MTYSSTSMFPVLLMILLLALYHTSEGIEYHVKPTDPEVTQCPGQPCQTLAEYLENKTWDYTLHARVVFMPGNHRVTQLFFVKLAFNLTLLGSTSVNHTLHDSRPILHIASIWFHGIGTLNLIGIVVIKSYEPKISLFAALKFTNIFTLQVSQIAVHSLLIGIHMENIFGNSVIEHSSFDTVSHGRHISLHYRDCPSHAEISECAIIRVLQVYLKSYLHANISIQDCIFRFKSFLGEGIYTTLELNSFPVQIDISNITTLGPRVNGIILRMQTKAPYTIRISNSLLENKENKLNGIDISSFIWF